MRTKNDDVATAAAIYARQSFELAGTPNSVSSEPGAGHIAFHCWGVLVRRRQDCANILGTPTSMRPSDSVCPGLLSTKRDGPVAAFPESYIGSGYE